MTWVNTYSSCGIGAPSSQIVRDRSTAYNLIGVHRILPTSDRFVCQEINSFLFLSTLPRLIIYAMGVKTQLLLYLI